MQIRSAYFQIDTLSGDKAADRRMADLVRALTEQGADVRVWVEGPLTDLPPELQALAAPAQHDTQTPLFDRADIALRGYRVHSGAPVVGRWIAAARRGLTAHVKEAYLDPIVERQVSYNRLLATEVERLAAEIKHLQSLMDILAGPTDPPSNPSAKDETP